MVIFFVKFCGNVDFCGLLCLLRSLAMTEDRGLYFLLSQKVAKTFLDSASQNLGGIVESTGRILRNCGIAG